MSSKSTCTSRRWTWHSDTCHLVTVPEADDWAPQGTCVCVCGVVSLTSPDQGSTAPSPNRTQLPPRKDALAEKEMISKGHVGIEP